MVARQDPIGSFVADILWLGVLTVAGIAVYRVVTENKATPLGGTPEGTVGTPLPRIWTKCTGPFAGLTGMYLQIYNPDFPQQMEEWQSTRYRNGQDPYDWNALRTHVIGLRAHDPGPDPYREFCERQF